MNMRGGHTFQFDNYAEYILKSLATIKILEDCTKGRLPTMQG